MKKKPPQSRDKCSSQEIPEEEKSEFYEAAAKHFKVCDQHLQNSNVHFKILNDQLLQKVVSSPGKGRYAVATSDLEPGTVVLQVNVFSIMCPPNNRSQCAKADQF